jgi:hypothetical protein
LNNQSYRDSEVVKKDSQKTTTSTQYEFTQNVTKPSTNAGVEQSMSDETVSGYFQ